MSISPGAVNATIHDSLDQGSQVLVIHSTFVLHKPAAVRAEDHGLVLEVTLSSLVADGAIQRVVHLVVPS